MTLIAYFKGIIVGFFSDIFSFFKPLLENIGFVFEPEYLSGQSNTALLALMQNIEYEIETRKPLPEYDTDALFAFPED